MLQFRGLYETEESNGLRTWSIDFDELRKQEPLFQLAMIIADDSTYPRIVDFAKFREISDEVSALLLTNMEHLSGLAATKQYVSPFEHSDRTTTVTHKSLREPHAAKTDLKLGLSAVLKAIDRIKCTSELTSISAVDHCLVDVHYLCIWILLRWTLRSHSYLRNPPPWRQSQTC